MKRAATTAAASPPTKRARFTVRGETFSASSDEESCDEIDDRFPLVPVPEPRYLNWDRILAAVPRDEQEATKRYILKYHLDYFIDGDHPVGYRGDDQKTLRFLPQTAWIEHAFDKGALDLNKMVFVPMTSLERRQFHRDLGYSLQRYGELSRLGHRGWFTRHMCDKAPTLLCETVRPQWFLQEGTCPCVL